MLRPASALALALALACCRPARAGSVEYDFFPVDGSGVAAVLVFDSPPASYLAGWSAGIDAIESFALGYDFVAVHDGSIGSAAGRRLDHGFLDASIPGLPVEVAFSPAAGGSEVSFGPASPDPPLFGDWLVLDPPSAVPEPAGWLLLVVGACCAASGRMAQRVSSRIRGLPRNPCQWISG